MQQKSDNIQVIQACRGVAAVLVLLYHKLDVINTSSHKWGNRLFGNGAFGVDLFFVISGFIMVLVANRPYKNKNNSAVASDFFIKRFFRIFPLYCICTLLFSVLVWKGFSFWPADHVRIVKSLRFEPLNANGLAPFYGYASLIVGWTLNYEMFFYLSFAIALLAGKKKYLFFLIWMVLIQLVLPLLICHQWHMDAYAHYHFKSAYLNMVTNPLLWDFVAGMGVAWVLVVKKWKASYAFFFMGAVVSFLIVVTRLWWPEIWLWTKSGHGIIRWGWSAGLLVFFLVGYEMNFGMKIPYILQFLGKISFSVYLLHPLVEYELKYWLLAYDLKSVYFSAAYLILSLLCTVGIATLSQKWVEIRLSNYLRDRFLFFLRSFSKT